MSLSPREIVLDAFHAACARIDLAGRVRAAVTDDHDRVVIAVGKAATAMLAGVPSFATALVVLPHDAPPPPQDPRVTVLFASHPLPDESSVRAANAALALAGSSEGGDRLFLVSGGASALLCAPAPGLSLSRKREVEGELLHARVSITDVNVVRRHLSRIKGGGLARVAADHARRTVVVSDVIGGAAHDVGSGPSVSDPTTIEDARHVAHRFSFGELPWVETWKHPEQAFICADPEAFALLVREELERRGLCDVTATAVEPVLDIPPNAGRGGRCTHAAALASLTLPPGTLFAALATDGVDGTSGTGGAIVLGPVGTPDQTREALARFDTGALHLAAGTAVPGGPTGLNFADLHVTARYGPSTALRTS